jgi:hypothetical protein
MDAEGLAKETEGAVGLVDLLLYLSHGRAGLRFDLIEARGDRVGVAADINSCDSYRSRHGYLDVFAGNK